MIDRLRDLARRTLQSPSLRLLIRDVWRRKPRLVGTLAVNALGALVEGTSLAFLGLAVSVLATGRLPGMADQVWALHFLPSEGAPLFLCLVALAIGGQVVRSFCGYLGSRFNIHLGTDARVQFQMELTRRMLGTPYHVTQVLRGGDMAEALLASSNTIVEIIDAMNRLLVYLMMIAVYASMLLWLAPGLTGLALGIFAVVLFLQRNLTAGVRIAANTAADDTAEMTATVLEQTQALRTIHSYSLQDRLLASSRHIFDRMRDSNRTMNNRYFGTQSISESAMLLAIGLFLVLAYFALRSEDGFPLANFVTFIAVLNRLSARFSAIQTGYNDLVRRVGLMARADEFLRQTEGVAGRHGGIALASLAREIRVEQVTLRYPGRDDHAVRDLSLTIARGETIGLVGESGAGKSTLTDLLLGLQEPTSGTIRIDGVDLATADLRSWTRQVATVSQDPFLFRGTIADNLRLVRPDVTAAQMEAALRTAGAWAFVQAMPQQVDTLVGDRGLKLSGGQRQRLALARALVCDPAVLVLDEATSALDSETEHAVQVALEGLRGRVTMVIVAHRLATIRQCDRILVMEAGRLIETGTHDELLARPSRYAHYWDKQAGRRESQSKQA